MITQARADIATGEDGSENARAARAEDSAYVCEEREGVSRASVYGKKRSGIQDTHVTYECNDMLLFS